jgi:hypothetical protein
LKYIYFVHRTRSGFTSQTVSKMEDGTIRGRIDLVRQRVDPQLFLVFAALPQAHEGGDTLFASKHWQIRVGFIFQFEDVDG